MLCAAAALALIPANSALGLLYTRLTGIGLTMSLFLGTLALPGEDTDVDIRIGVLIASIASAVCGHPLLRVAAGTGQPKSTVTTS